MNSKNQVALHYKFPELHSRDQYSLCVYYDPKKSAYCVFLLLLLDRKSVV